MESITWGAVVFNLAGEVVKRLIIPVKVSSRVFTEYSIALNARMIVDVSLQDLLPKRSDFWKFLSEGMR